MRLYRGFTSQDEIDREYNAGAAVPDNASIVANWVAESARVREQSISRLGLKYGPTVEEYLDFFSGGSGTPLHIFIHGGYWRRFTAREFSFVAAGLNREGVSVAVVNYALCPRVTIDEITRQIRAAIAWCHTHAKMLDCDPQRLTVSGHSAGGHLTGMALATDWERDYGLPLDTLKGGVPISGLFDLAPFPYSYLQPSLQLTWDQVARNSPINQVRPATAPQLVAVGGNESGEFRRQSKDYASTCQSKGSSAHYFEIEGANHFTVLGEIFDSSTAAFARLLTTARSG